MIERSFPVIHGKLVTDTAADTLLVNFDYFQSFEYDKTSKKFFQKPPTYLKHQVDASCGNFGVNGFPKTRNNILTELLISTDD